MKGRVAADLVFIAAVLFVVGMIGFDLGQHFPKEPKVIERTDTVVVLKHDTSFIDSPVPVYVEKVRTEYLALTDTVRMNDTLFVPVPIEQKVYEDSTYRAVISGYKANLDSLWLYRTTKYVTVTNTIEKKRSKWGFNATVGPSVLITPKGGLYGGFGATVGVGYSF